MQEALSLQAPDRDDQEEPRTSGTTEGGGFTKAQPTEKSTEASPVPEEGLASPLLTPPSSTLASPACSALGESLRALAPGHWQVSAMEVRPECRGSPFAVKGAQAQGLD